MKESVQGEYVGPYLLVGETRAWKLLKAKVAGTKVAGARVAGAEVAGAKVSQSKVAESEGCCWR